ncbi:NlpC/P60 family protein [Dyella telluris]|uniref:C40 family peptidase n=1 Tax=Dyella telluris TaxID=2763498 RepID=A0A7G8Q4F1_9GAMM|nr:NlpC/P60 family protein [Dyella telluris]QNK01659.1 C40 family peptidase [Dyella telluris]
MIAYADLLDVPFAYGGRDHNGMDCYGLLMEMYRRKGVIIPDVTSSTNGLLNESNLLIQRDSVWKSVERQPHVAVLFRMGRYVCHVGFAITEDRFVHTMENGLGVASEKFRDWEHRIAGFVDFVG